MDLIILDPVVIAAMSATHFTTEFASLFHLADFTLGDVTLEESMSNNFE